MIDLVLYRLKRPWHFFKTGLGQGLRGEVTAGFPARKLTILAITGTDGKTSTSTMLYHVLKSAGKKVGLISTVAAYIGDEEIDTGFHVTTPDPYQMHHLLKKMLAQGIEYVVLETTSHGLYQYRTWGIHPTIAGYTNIAHEHLDYHLNYGEYVKAKAQLGQQAEQVILNADDQSFTPLKKLIKSSKITTYSKSDRIYTKVVQAIRTRFPESYNQMNARLVYAFAQKLGISNEDFIEAISSFPGVPGRMEVVATSPYQIIVDFAHTPQALEAALQSLRQQLGKRGKLTAVFGCAGLRDRQKRPLMGKIGADLADLAIFTAEDPRTEDVWSIIRRMKEGAVDHIDKVASIPDRRQAIAFAIDQAKKGDIIGIFGKGHEQSMCFGTTEHPWSDKQVVQELLSRK